MLERYKILHELGRGATGAVYAARDRTTGAPAALKRLDPALSKPDATVAQRFVQQARAAQRLKHPSIVRIHDAGEAAGTAYVAMELVEGRNLRSLLDQGPLPVAQAIRILRDVAGGVAHAHLEGMVHGSLKPSSILVSDSGAAKITGFGTGQAAAGYTAPEQAQGGPVDHRCDVFSLGALFYEMLTGTRASEGAPRPPSELNPLVPRALDTLVLHMLAPQPAARMPGVPVLLAELQRLEEGLGLGSLARFEPQAANEPEVEAPAPSPADAFQHRQITEREILEYERAMRAARAGPPPRSSRPGIATFAGLALVLAVLGFGMAEFMGVTRFMDDWSGRGIGDTAANRVRHAPAPVAEAAKQPAMPSTSEPVGPTTAAAGPTHAPQPMAEAPRRPEIPSVRDLMPQPLATQPAAQSESESETQPEPSVATAPEPLAAPKQLPRTAQPKAKLPPQQPGGTARLILAVSPRGELYINGEHRGTTPPITTFELEPGMHRVEVRNGSRRPYLTYMTVEPGDVRRIRHDFDAKRGGPPR
ncbi:MAG TPA: protein kinase [Burkholderiales bacterium]|nr:protein kinase [Burkholderiales bacterium]